MMRRRADDDDRSTWLWDEEAKKAAQPAPEPIPTPASKELVVVPTTAPLAASTNNVVPFSFEGTEVRVMEREGAPWWVLADVCGVLELAKPDRAASRLDEDEKAPHTVSTLGGPQEMTIINESGLWSLVLTSRKPSAKRFKKWLTSEVIPAIRKTGGYMVARPEETPEELALRAMEVLRATVERQRQELALSAPKAAAFGAVLGTSGMVRWGKVGSTAKKAAK